jgi:hypothetical protein
MTHVFEQQEEELKEEEEEEEKKSWTHTSQEPEAC